MSLIELMVNLLKENQEYRRRLCICEICGEGALRIQRHHKFSQTKWARKLYGDLIDDPRNIQIVCGDCHASHRSERLIHWSENEFCEAIGIELRSKHRNNI